MTVQEQHSVISNCDLWLTQVLEAAEFVIVTVIQPELMSIKHTGQTPCIASAPTPATAQQSLARLWGFSNIAATQRPVL